MTRKAEPKDYSMIFEHNKDGELILEDLVARFTREPKLNIEADGITNAFSEYEAKGARKVINYIVSQINRANGLGEEDE